MTDQSAWRQILAPAPLYLPIPKNQKRARTALIPTDPAGTRLAAGVGPRAVGAGGVVPPGGGEVRDDEVRVGQVRPGAAKGSSTAVAVPGPAPPPSRARRRSRSVGVSSS